MVAEETGTSGVAFVPAATFVGRGVVAVRIPPALGLLASASLVAVGTQTHEHASVLRGTAWNSPPLSLSAEAAYVLYTVLLPSYASSGSLFSSCSMAALACHPHFAGQGLSAAKAAVGALEELNDCGVVVVSKWRGSLFPVALLNDVKPSREEVKLAWTPASSRQQQAAQALTDVVSFFTDSSCIYLRLCALFGDEDEKERVVKECKCFVCHSELPLR